MDLILMIFAMIMVMEKIVIKRILKMNSCQCRLILYVNWPWLILLVMVIVMRRRKMMMRAAEMILRIWGILMMGECC